jgi:superfamily II DNA/RNA helicase
MNVKNKPIDEKEINFPEKFPSYWKIPKVIQNNLINLGLETLTPIQKLTFGYSFNYENKFFDNNHDLVWCAQTGSGKTLSIFNYICFIFIQWLWRYSTNNKKRK